MMVFMQFAGFTTVVEPIFDFFGITFNSANELTGLTPTTSSIWDYLIDNLLAGIVSAGVTLGLLAAGRYDIAIRAGFASAVLFSFIAAMIGIVTYGMGTFPSWATATIAIIFIPLIGGYFFALVEYVFGTD